MLDFVGLSVVFAIMTIGIPHTVTSLVGGSIGLALAHAFEAAYIARTIVSPITSGLKKIPDGISGFAKGSSDQRRRCAERHARHIETASA